MENSNQHFGLMVAYLLPGFIALGGVALLVPSVAEWLRPVESGSEIAPPVYAVLAATAVGMIVSCFRWFLIDHIHSWMGLRPPVWEVERLQQRLGVFNYFVEYHYRYHQFYANTLIAVLWTYAINRLLATSSLLGLLTDFGLLVLCAVLFAGSRDALSKYYDRTNRLLGPIAEKDKTGDCMTNGCHEKETGCGTTATRLEAKLQPKRNKAKRELQRKKATARSKQSLTRAS